MKGFWAPLLLWVVVALANAYELELDFQADGDSEGSSLHHLDTHPSVHDRDLIVKKPTITSIIKEHQRYGNASAHEKFFPGRTLAYVTPWNNHGYDIAKFFAGKFTHLSPVWYTVQVSKSGKYELHGAHDVDKGWIQDVIAPAGSKGKKAKIVPRFNLQVNSKEEFSNLVENIKIQQMIASLIVNECRIQGFDGFVFEFQLSGHTPKLIKKLSELSRNGPNVLEFILVIAPANPSFEHIIFTQAHFNDLKIYVDGFSLMTYDFSNPQSPGPNAPIEWVSENIIRLCPGEEDRFKLLVGINMYGNIYTSTKSDTVTGRSYIEFLQSNPDNQLTWDSEFEEHVINFKDNNKMGSLWYPSLKSIDQRLLLFEELQTGLSIWEIGQGLDYFYDLL